MGDTLLAPGATKAAVPPITDPKVCRSYLVGTCPHDLFTNTKNDLGLCPKVHNESLKSEYDDATSEQKAKWAFEWDYMRDMGQHVDACNRKIEQLQRRLDKTPEEMRQTAALVKGISDLSATIAAGLAEISTLAEMGQINQAVSEHYKLRATQQAKADKERELRSLAETSGPSGHQKLQVCDVCGAYLSRLDNDRRLADHFYGKMHLGYATMRKTYGELREELKGKSMPSRDWDPPVRSEEGGYGDGGGWGGRGGFDGGYGRGGYGRGGPGGFRGGRGRGGFQQRW